MKNDRQQDQVICTGRNVLPYLAEIYQQLYLTPGSEGAEFYPQIVQNGKDAPAKTLSHFRMNENDRLELVETPSGPVQVLTLFERKDFETFLQIMVNKCVPYEVPASQGASTLDGLNNWKRIKDHKEAWFREQISEGNYIPDWGAELKRFISDKSNYKDILIVLSIGPYSNIPASAAGFEEEEWLKRSYMIRKYHECTHVVCRRLYREQIEPIWDEVVADAAGIYAALGAFDLSMEELFLGVSENGYTGGRLENYMNKDEDIHAAARKIHEVLCKIDALYQTTLQGQDLPPLEFALRIEEKQKEWWGLPSV